jgi:4-alpha-glucanotransferase
VSAADGGIRRRAAGILLPLSSLRGARDWGVGEFGHVPAISRWLSAAGHRVLQLLPVTEVAPGERSPYAALTAFALDPVYLSLDAVEDFVAAGGETALPAAARAALAAARASSGIDYDAVRVAKQAALEIGFRRFRDTEWRGSSERAHALRAFLGREATWIEDYALFRVLAEERGGVPWPRWEPALRARDPVALAAARAATEERRLFHVYVQWIAAAQWAAARAGAGAAGVCLKGDLPFVVARDSADVWERQGEFRLDVSLGAPPDAFNTAGQDWGLPVYRFAAMAAGNHAWLRARAARTAALFDAVRLDHVVGFYRQYVIAPDGSAGFEPASETEQRALGEELVRITQEAAADTQLVGEDLGVVPPFVRASLARLGIPGYRVLRWEADAGVFRDPRTYPTSSVATSGTHDTTPLATWWEEELDSAARQALAAVAPFATLARADARFTPAVHAALLDGLYAAGSALAVIPLPDAYGGRERINVPATTGPTNWDYRMPWGVERLDHGAAEALRARLAALAARHGRS